MASVNVEAEVKVEGYSSVPGVDVMDFRFEPLRFVRCHTEDGQPPEAGLQVWDVVIEGGSGGRVATCGGRYVCISAMHTGELLMRYRHPTSGSTFFSLSWTEVEGRGLLAAGDSLGEVRLFHPSGKLCIARWSVEGERDRGTEVYAVQFHDSRPAWLFVATKDSVATLWDIGAPSPPDYGASRSPQQLLRLTADTSPDLYALAWVPDTRWLLAGTAEGLVGWRVETTESRSRSTPRRAAVVEFELVEEVGEYGETVDSVCSLGRGLVAAKCVNYGKILVFRAEFPALEEQGRTGNLCRVEVLAEFAWRITMNFFLNIGGGTAYGLMACGDDEGTVWLYALPAWLAEGAPAPAALPAKLLPFGRIPWPELQGVDRREGEKEVFIDKVAFSRDGRGLVAVTNNNMVAFWRRLGPATS